MDGWTEYYKMREIWKSKADGCWLGIEIVTFFIKVSYSVCLGSALDDLYPRNDPELERLIVYFVK